MGDASDAYKTWNASRGGSRAPGSGPVAGGGPVADAPANPLATIKMATFEAPTFNVSSFLEEIMEKDVKQSQASGQFDPAPYIATLEAAVGVLLPIRKANAQQIAELDRQVASAERGYQSDVRGLKVGFSTISSQFQMLDSRLGDVAKSAVRIGDQLDSIDRLKSKAIESRDLIVYYGDFARGDASRFDRLRKEEGWEGRRKVAAAARKLLVLAREADDGRAGAYARVARSHIEKYAEKFEKDMLRMFDRYYRKGDPKTMAQCAHVLERFNGGQSCVQIYVNQHDFFISRERLDTLSGPGAGPLWAVLADPVVRPPRAEPRLAALCAEIRRTFDQEAQIISAVFPDAALVMHVFLQRVFAQVVQSCVEGLVSAAARLSPLAQLRILAATRAQTAELVKDLTAHPFFRARVEPREFHLTGGGSAGGAAPRERAAAFLDAALAELFAPFLDAPRYLDLEVQSLQQLYTQLLAPFHEAHRPKEGSLLGRVVPGAPGEARGSSSGPTSSAIAGTAGAAFPGTLRGDGDSRTSQDRTRDPSRLDRFISGLSTMASGHGVGVAHSGANHSDTGVWDTGDTGSKGMQTSPSHASFEQAGQGTTGGSAPLASLGAAAATPIDTCQAMLTWHAEAIGRMVALSTSGDISKNAFILFKVLCDAYCRDYLEAALASAGALLSAQDGKSAPDLAPLLAVRDVERGVALLQRYVDAGLVPLTSASATARRELVAYTEHVVARVASGVAGVLARATELTLTHVSVCLGKQKKADFRPKNDDIAFATMNTAVSLKVTSCLDSARRAADAALSGGNRDAFCAALGTAVYDLLLEHVRRFQISPAGGLILTKDLALYQECISNFDVPALNTLFDFLRQLGNVYIVQPDILKTYLQESFKIERRHLRPFISQRTDYGDYSKRFWDDTFGGE